MANNENKIYHDPRIETLDEFDDAEVLSSAFCQQMTEEEYEEQTSAETQKALDELIQYLQAHPEHYFQIICKRKQEEMENAGLFSYLKVKMMGIFHGERYPACLVSPQQSAEQLAQLKTDMQKAFVYSEESKGRRFSKRIAARVAQTANTEDKENTPVTSSQLVARRTRLNVDEKSSTLSSSGFESARVVRSTTPASKHAGLTKTSLPPVATVMPNQSVTTAVITNGAPAGVHSATAPAAPPPPPPPPLLFLHQLRLRRTQTDSCSNSNDSPTSSISKGGRHLRKRSLPRGDLSLQSSNTVLSPDHVVPPRKQKVSPTSYLGESRARQELDCGYRAPAPTSQFSSPSDTEFVTPESDLPSQPKRHKRTLSNVSTGSFTSLSSLISIHSELVSSNPMGRLRSTQIPRSPGGTPLRFGPSTPKEPLHKALVTVLREKFKNVRTPSPLARANSTSAFSPNVTSNNSLNCTFSP